MNSPSADLSVIVITRNEERNIVDCLKSVSWADDLVVVDSQSTDRTADLARTLTSNVFVEEWKGYGGMKNFALSKCKKEWVLWLDADERVTPELRGEIEAILRENGQVVSGFEVARKAYFLGHWIAHCGWYPGYVVRLFRRRGASFTTSRVHERLNVDGSIGKLKNDLLHFTDDTLYHYFTKFNQYTTLAAEDLMAQKYRFSLYDLAVRPPFSFFKMYVLRRGFLDGMPGLILSLASSAYVFCKYAKLWEMQRRQSAAAG